MPKSKKPKRDHRDGISVYKGKFRISYIDGQGRRRQQTVHAATVQQAQMARAKRLMEAETQRTLGYVPPVPTTEDSFNKFAQQRYLPYQKSRIVPKSYQRTLGVITKHLQPALGAKRLAVVSRADVEQYVTDRRLVVSKASVAKELNVLKHMFALAVAWELIAANPADGVKPYDRPPAGRLRYLQPTEMRGLLEACPTWLRPMVLLLLATGMRRGELLGLRRLDVYRAKKQILLPQTKNGKARTVSLNRMACQVLDCLPHAQDARPTDRVFAITAYSTPENVSVSFQRACRRAKIADFHLHDLRHTCASWMVMQGADIHTVAAQLGHNVQQAARYAHLSPAYLQKAVGGLDAVFPPTLALPAAPRADTYRIPIEPKAGPNRA